MSVSRDGSRTFDLDSEFPVIDNILYARIDGYFSTTLKTTIPCTSTTHNCYVQYVIDPETVIDMLFAGQIRLYYRTMLDGYHAVFRSNNVVKTMKVGRELERGTEGGIRRVN